MAPLQSQSVTFCGLAKVLAKPNYELGIGRQPPDNRGAVRFAKGYTEMRGSGSQCLIPGVSSIEGCRRILDHSSAQVGGVWFRLHDMGHAGNSTRQEAKWYFTSQGVRFRSEE